MQKNHEDTKKHGDHEECLKKMQEMQKKCEELTHGWKRALADYQNLQKATQQQMDDFRKYANEDMIMQLLPLADYFQHAFDQIPEAEKNSPWLTGIKHIQSYFNKILQDNNVTEIKALGEKTNPEVHEIVKEEVSEQPEGIIIKVNQAGYKIEDKVIRPAKVTISKKSLDKLETLASKGGEKK